MTPAFTSRAFEELCSKASQGSALGFEGFVNFQAAWAHRSHPQALRLLFPFLCHPGRSTLSQARLSGTFPAWQTAEAAETPACAQAEVHSHVSQVMVLWRRAGQLEELDPAHIADEVLDMAKPARQGTICCEDLLVSVCLNEQPAAAAAGSLSEGLGAGVRHGQPGARAAVRRVPLLRVGEQGDAAAAAGGAVSWRPRHNNGDCCSPQLSFVRLCITAVEACGAPFALAAVGSLGCLREVPSQHAMKSSWP